ncbi:BMC domain-containing protein [Paenibacillus sp. IHB B 3415]|uniref:BMC domain-containing protein n=1 Tax=Paenibacillus sp. IHB B 3415 TaxID=867080 RepID=UPI0007C85311|nr:BMC domain-containing protein [Paenibacillus sp. IHB B 3415]
MQALGLIETLGYTTAVSAADAALKAANVQLIAVEKVIGVGGSLGVTIHLSGDVAAVAAAVDAGKAEARRIGTVISAHVIAKAHEDVNRKILSRFLPGLPADSKTTDAGTTSDGAKSAAPAILAEADQTDQTGTASTSAPDLPEIE